MVKTDYSPLKFGFHFGNEFKDKIVNTPFGKFETRGRCGGMAFASLDYYYAGIPSPSHESKDFPNKAFAPNGSMLGDYILKRAFDSIVSTSSLKFLFWSVAKNIKAIDIFQKSLNNEFQKLKRSIDNGKPVVLGLISDSESLGVTMNHQVVAYGYDLKTKGEIAICIYDSNTPNKEVQLKLTMSDLKIRASNGKVWRAFFIQNYKSKIPDYRDLDICENTREQEMPELKPGKGSSKLAGKKYKICNIGQFPANLKYINANYQVYVELLDRNLVLQPGEALML